MRDPLVQAVLAQIEVAIDSAQLIILAVNALEGLVPLDLEVANRLRKSGKRVLVVINKVDNPALGATVGEFAELGFDLMLPVSAIHGTGIEALMDTALGELSKVEIPSAARGDLGPGVVQDSSFRAWPAGPLKLAIVGRPNVGKSSLVNGLTRSERVVVSPIPGTTRDAIDVPFEIETDGVRQSYLLIDTAGIRKKRQVDDSIEFFSIKRAESSIRRCDIVVFVLDTEAGILEQDPLAA
ncbi:MAG: GTP-binding protein, partial [Candidatus Omnitrophica bacterium]|nr:GTP-binding protein [Candidatus Omnitrophota bacterium]